MPSSGPCSSVADFEFSSFWGSHQRRGLSIQWMYSRLSKTAGSFHLSKTAVGVNFGLYLSRDWLRFGL